MSRQLVSSISTPSAPRLAAARRSGSPGSRIVSWPGAGRDALMCAADEATETDADLPIVREGDDDPADDGPRPA